MSTITGTVLRGDDAAPAGNVIFTPLSAPVVDGSVLVCGDPVPVTPANDGTFTVTLRPGTYSVRLPGVRSAIQIGVPDDSATYALTDLVSSRSNLSVADSPIVTQALWSDERLKEIVQKASVKLLDGQPITVNGTSRAIWPDLVEGVYTTTHISIVNTVVLVDGFTITHPDAGKLITQPQVTRDVNGRVTTEPELTITDLP